MTSETLTAALLYLPRRIGEVLAWAVLGIAWSLLVPVMWLVGTVEVWLRGDE